MVKIKFTKLKLFSTAIWLLVGSYLTIQSIIFLAYLGQDAKVTIASNLLFGTILLILLWGWLPNMWTKNLNKSISGIISLSLLLMVIMLTMLVVKQSPYFLYSPIKSQVNWAYVSYFIFCIRKIVPYLKIMKDD